MRPLIYSNDLVEIDAKKQVWKLLEYSDGPSARNFHSCCLRGGSGEIIIFGGKSNGFHHDVYSLNLEEGKWIKLACKFEEVISPRYGQSATIYKDCLYVFGGYDNNSFPSNELFQLNFNTLEWKLVELDCIDPIQKRYFHSATLDEETGEWYIMGGKNPTSLVSDMIKIDLSSCNQVETQFKCNASVLIKKLPKNSSRFGHSMVLENEKGKKKLFTIGGCNQKADFTDCLCLSLDDLPGGWKIVKLHALSKIFDGSNPDVKPVFHSIAQYLIDGAYNYFVFGGNYQKTDEKTIILQQQPIRKEPIDPIDLGMFNDDIFRMILSFLPIPDNLRVELVSKKLRICNLTTEDQFWKDYYFEKVALMKESTMKQTWMFSSGKYEIVAQYSASFDSYLEIKSDYKRNLINLVEKIMTKAHKKYLERTTYIEQLTPNLEKFPYFTKEEIKSTKLKNGSMGNVRKTVQVGDGAVGKTCLWMRLANGVYPVDYVPTIFDNYNVTTMFDGFTVDLGLWDTAGPEDYDRLRPLSYPGTHAFILSFSCMSDSSFENIPHKWIPEIRRHAPNTPIILCCNKIDRRNDELSLKQHLIKNETKPISFEQGELMAKKMGCITYIETSAKENIGMDVFEIMAKVCGMDGTTPAKRGNRNCQLQ